MILFAALALAGALAAAAEAQEPPAPPPPPAPNTTSIFVPRGVVVPVTVTKDVRVGGANAATAQQSGKVRFAVTQDVVVDGYIIAKAGDLVEGHYDSATNVTHRTFSTNASQEVVLALDDAVNFAATRCTSTSSVPLSAARAAASYPSAFTPTTRSSAKASILRADTDRGEKSVCAAAATEPAKALPANMVLPDNELAPRNRA